MTEDARDEGENHVPVRPERLGQADRRTHLGSREVIEWEGNQDDLAFGHGGMAFSKGIPSAVL